MVAENRKIMQGTSIESRSKQTWAINIGFTSVKQLPKNCAYNNIYTLQQLKERKVKLDKIPTKKEEKESAVITRGFIEKEIKSISDIIKDIQEKIDNFNSAAKIAS